MLSVHIIQFSDYWKLVRNDDNLCIASLVVSDAGFGKVAIEYCSRDYEGPCVSALVT